MLHSHIGGFLMPYCTPTDVRIRAVGMTEEVIPDVSEESLNLTSCVAEAQAEIDEAARAGGYETPFDPAPDRVRDLCAVGALAKARRALELGNQPGEQGSPYRSEFEAGIDLLRQGRLDLGTVKVADEEIAISSDDGDWASLAHRGLLHGSVTVTNTGSTFTYVEDRGGYEPGYRIGSIKDYQVDHREGRIRRLTGGRIGPGQSVLVSYEYSCRRPSRADEAEYEGRTASGGEMVRGDVQE